MLPKNFPIRQLHRNGPLLLLWGNIAALCLIIVLELSVVILLGSAVVLGDPLLTKWAQTLLLVGSAFSRSLANASPTPSPPTPPRFFAPLARYRAVLLPFCRIPSCTVTLPSRSGSLSSRLAVSRLVPVAWRDVPLPSRNALCRNVAPVAVLYVCVAAFRPRYARYTLVQLSSRLLPRGCVTFLSCTVPSRRVPVSPPLVP